MLKIFKNLLLLLSFSLLTACGWHFKNSTMMPEQLRTLSFSSADEYSDMSRTLRNQMLLSNIHIVPKANNVANLRLNSTENTSRVASVFKQAREAEKILTLTVKATLTLPTQNTSYPLEVYVNRTFFDDSRAALAKSEEKETILHQMYEQASQQLIIKMAGLQYGLNQNK